MPTDEYSLRHYVAANGKSPFAEWLCSLPDRNAAARVQIRLERLRLGNFGDARSLGKGLSELHRYWSGIPGLLHGRRQIGRDAFMRWGQEYSTKGHPSCQRISDGLPEEDRCLEVHRMTIF